MSEFGVRWANDVTTFMTTADRGKESILSDKEPFATVVVRM